MINNSRDVIINTIDRAKTAYDLDRKTGYVSSDPCDAMMYGKEGEKFASILHNNRDFFYDCKDANTFPEFINVLQNNINL